MRKPLTEERRQEVARAYLDTSLPIAERSSRALARRYGVSHRTILNDLKARGMEERHEKAAAGGSKAVRQAIVLERYATDTCAEIAAEVRRRTGKPCSVGPIKRDVAELQREGFLVVRKAAPRRKHPEPEPRLCGCDCGELARPGGKYVDREHESRAKRARALATAGEAAARWNRGETLDEIERARPDLPRHRVWRAFRIAREDGSLEVVERRRGKQPGRYRERGRLVKCGAREFGWCPHGDAERWVFASHDTEFLSPACWARFRIARRIETMEGAWRSIPAGRVRQKLLGRLGGTVAAMNAKAAGTIGRPRALASPEQFAEIQRLAAQGWGRRAIASRLGLSERAIRNVLAT